MFFSAKNINSLLLMLLVGLSALGHAENNPALIHDVRLWRAPDNTRIVFDLDSAVEHKIFTLQNPDRVVVDIANAKLEANTDAVDLKGSPIASIRTSGDGKQDLRVVFDLSSRVNVRSFFLKKSGEADDRLVIDLGDLSAKKNTVVKTVNEEKKAKRDLIVAIDAGHGGGDPGASGPHRIREKNVVLAIAKELQALFAKEKGYKPVLIREGDYYVGLSQRRDLARQARADMFVSIHADAFSSPKAYGSSVYALSSKGASSATARFLADSENASDLVGGVSLNDKDALLSSVLVDLSMTYKMESSLDVGSEVLKHMGNVSRLHSKRVEQAAFAVLKTPDIPSILVETGFISNPEEARKLNSSSYQKQVARAIFNGINGYFYEKAPEGSYIAWKSSQDHKVATHVVVQGDTLSEIANRYAVSMSQLKAHNRLGSNMLQVGQTLQIPAN